MRIPLVIPVNPSINPTKIPWKSHENPIGHRFFILVGGFNPSEKYEFVSWDDDILNISWKNKIHVPNHQPVM
jgi:hypothetical protein